MKLYRIVDDANKNKSPWMSDHSLIEEYINRYRWCSDNYNDNSYNDKDRIFVESVTIPEESLEPELEEAYEWKNNKLTTITKNIY